MKRKLKKKISIENKLGQLLAGLIGRCDLRKSKHSQIRLRALTFVLTSHQTPLQKPKVLTYVLYIACLGQFLIKWHMMSKTPSPILQGKDCYTDAIIS